MMKFIGNICTSILKWEGGEVNIWWVNIEIFYTRFIQEYPFKNNQLLISATYIQKDISKIIPNNSKTAN